MMEEDIRQLLIRLRIWADDRYWYRCCWWLLHQKRDVVVFRAASDQQQSRRGLVASYYSIMTARFNQSVSSILTCRIGSDSTYSFENICVSFFLLITIIHRSLKRKILVEQMRNSIRHWLKLFDEEKKSNVLDDYPSLSRSCRLILSWSTFSMTLPMYICVCVILLTFDWAHTHGQSDHHGNKILANVKSSRKYFTLSSSSLNNWQMNVWILFTLWRVMVEHMWYVYDVFVQSIKTPNKSNLTPGDTFSS